MAENNKIFHNYESGSHNSIITDSTNYGQTHHNYCETSQPTHAQVIEFILSLELPPLPVAPAQSADRYPVSYPDENGTWQPKLDKDGNKQQRFTGKNPSYIDVKGMPRIIKHSIYQDRQPTSAELKTWFSRSDVGIGTLGTDEIIWIDLDKKQFENQAECDRRFYSWLDTHPQLKESWIEKTHSGGYRLAVKVPKKPSFTNFSLDGIGGKHHGEALGYGRFTVLAPTIGVSGNAYTCLNLAAPVEVESLESIGIYPVATEKAKKESKPQKGEQNHTDYDFEQPKFEDEISIKLLVSANIQLMMGDSCPPDRSHALVRVARELFGWVKWLQTKRIGVKENIQNLLLETADNMRLETHRIDAILKSVNVGDCLPSIHFVAGDLGCWRKIKKHCVDLFLKLCPAEIKETLKIPVRHLQKMPNGIEFESSKFFSFDLLNKWYAKKKYTPTVVQNSPEIDMSNIPKKNAVVGLKTAMGGGKTEVNLNQIKDSFVRSLWIAPRAKLIIQTVARATEKDIRMYLVNEEDGLDLLLDDNTHLAFCGESSHKLDGRFAGVDLYIDEATCVFKQLLGGGTVSGNRQGHILKVIKKAIAECNRVVLMDANLTDDVVNLIASFAPEKEVVKIENTYTRGSANIQIIETTALMKDDSIEIRKKDKSPLIERLLNSPAEKFAIPCDSKQTCKDVEKLMFDAGLWGFNLNQETSGETWQELFTRMPEIQERVGKLVIDRTKKWSDELLNDPNKFILKYKPDFFVFSPTAENGISITCKYFTQIIALFSGVLTADAQSQMLFRVRDLEIARIVHCPETGLKTKTSYPYAELVDAALKAERELISQCYPEIEDFNEVMRLAWERIDKDWLDYANKIETIEHFEKDNLRACLMFQLRSMGHSVEIAEEMKNENVNKAIKLAHSELIEQEASEIFNAEPFEDMETAKEAFKKTQNKATARRKEKTRILTSLPGIEESEIWSTDFIVECFVKDKHCLSENQKYWLLMNPEVEEKSNDFWNYIKLSTEFVTINSVKNETQALLIGLRKLGIDTLIKELENGFTFTKNSPQIQKILTKARKDKQLSKIKTFQPNKETIHQKEVVEFIRSLLSLVGVKLQAKERARDENGKQMHWYGIDQDKHQHCYRLAMLEGIKKQYTQWLAEKYIKPDWDYLKTEGKLPNEFRQVLSEEDNGQAERITIEDQLQGQVLFTAEGEYTLPASPILKIFRMYCEVLTGKRELESLNYSKYALDQAMVLFADAERLPPVGEYLGLAGLMCC